MIPGCQVIYVRSARVKQLPYQYNADERLVLAISYRHPEPAEARSYPLGPAQISLPDFRHYRLASALNVGLDVLGV